MQISARTQLKGTIVDVVKGATTADRAYLLRDGARIAEGPVRQILTRERLETLYGAPVHMIADATGTAFIPG